MDAAERRVSCLDGALISASFAGIVVFFSLVLFKNFAGGRVRSIGWYTDDTVMPYGGQSSGLFFLLSS